MAVSYELDRELGIFELRESFLEHTRQAWQLLPPFESVTPRILDIGCGTGTPTLELARLSGGEVVGIDIDEAALEVLHRRSIAAGLDGRITTHCVSLLQTGFADASFDLLWEEGVLHMLDVDRSLGECRRLLKFGCHLVMHETTRWLDGIRRQLADHGFAVRAEHPLPEHIWLTHWAEPLDARLRAYERAHDLEALDEVTAAALASHRAAVASIRADPDATSCAYWVAGRVE
jgi:SAM-dependent methyltransferase